MALLALALAATLAGQAPARTIGPPRGALVIVGGGRVGPEIWARFIDLAGGPAARIVVIPTAGESVPDDGQVPRTNTPEVLHHLGIQQVTVLHTSDRRVADTAAFIAPLRDATGVWFDGGRQWHLADSYLNTRTYDEFEGVLARGGVIGGSSAGASILGDFLWRGDTKGPDKGEGDHRAGFAFLAKTAIDQHILVRNRQFDLIPFVRRHPDYLGIGINESAAIVVQQNVFQVIGASVVAITDAKKWGAGAKSPNDAAHKGGIYFLSPGQRYDLARREIVGP